jgi:hypothetical protein
VVVKTSSVVHWYQQFVTPFDAELQVGFGDAVVGAPIMTQFPATLQEKESSPVTNEVSARILMY